MPEKKVGVGGPCPNDSPAPRTEGVPGLQRSKPSPASAPFCALCGSGSRIEGHRVLGRGRATRFAPRRPGLALAEPLRGVCPSFLLRPARSSGVSRSPGSSWSRRSAPTAPSSVSDLCAPPRAGLRPGVPACLLLREAEAGCPAPASHRVLSGWCVQGAGTVAPATLTRVPAGTGALPSQGFQRLRIPSESDHSRRVSTLRFGTGSAALCRQLWHRIRVARAGEESPVLRRCPVPASAPA
ncbi:PREDICTED: uncharacterized protein LOC105511019 [Colobus angolensis palliatus]|uniref:uncharacterized protein LOC105511019 n=1 Tax=Colobus angolensis palliatus TaxID=336983 RepID=UPI0005F5420D|nr:PREDICTED: uncharacterized protein LOC105511019 [Colobus angolensis palliatus]